MREFKVQLIRKEAKVTQDQDYQEKQRQTVEL